MGANPDTRNFRLPTPDFRAKRPPRRSDLTCCAIGLLHCSLLHACPALHSTCVMQQQQQQQQPEQQPLPPLIPPPILSPAAISASPSSSSPSTNTATNAPLLPLACRLCSSPAHPTCIHARCAVCCRQLMLYCPAHDSRASLVGARFAAVLDGSVNGGLRLTAQLGDRIYHGVLFTGPAAVRMQRVSITTGSGSCEVQQQQQQAAKRHKPASTDGAMPNEASSSSTAELPQHTAITAANDNTAQPP